MPDEDRHIAHLTAERLAAYIDGRLTPPEHNAALAHFDDCADCRREMTDARRVIALATPAQPEPARAPTPSRRVWPLIAVALAAALVFVAVPTVLRNRNGAGGATDGATDGATRAPDRLPESETVSQLATVTPLDDAAVSLASDTFVWRAASADAEYRVRIVDATGGIVWSRSTVDTSVTLPADLRLVRGTEYFWSVDALLADGHSMTTRAHHFSIR